MGFASFFVGLVVFLESPFATLPRAAAEGTGLTPLLRYPSMMIHPPMLYSGYTLCAVPMAFGVGALMARRVDAEWIAATRRFALAAWLFLGIGIVLGARWSYVELGWGGYWGWDPVENASLMPWLIATAFIHSIMIQEKRGMLRMWNASLCLATGTLAIVGTFLVRSGDHRLDPRVRRAGQRDRVGVHGADRGLRGRVDLARVLAPRDPQVRASPRFAAVARGAVPVQQSAARRAVLRRLLGDVLPADLRGA